MTSKLKGRPPSVQPRTAFDVRRYQTLVQVLALDSASALRELAAAWELDSGGDCQELVSRLAQHVVEYHKTAGSVRSRLAALPRRRRPY